MSSNFRYPNITGGTDGAKLGQIQSYLHQLVDQLNYSLKTIEASGSAAYSGSTEAVQTRAGTAEKQNDANSTFRSIKSLIIKSADIVNAYYEEINKRLSGMYVAESDFGTYTEQTTSNIEANSNAIKQFYDNLQQIVTDIDTLKNSRIETSAYINSGLLDHDDAGVPVYGLEIGQRTEIDGEETFNKYARFTADELSFYDRNGNKVAYISDKKLYITHIEVIGSFTIGGLVDTVLADGSVVTK